MVIIYLLSAIFAWYCWSVLARRLGYEVPWMAGLLMLIPVVNVGLLLFLVLNESPNEKRLRSAASEPEESQTHAPEETCLQCGAPMPEDMMSCASCGWSYSTDADE